MKEIEALDRVVKETLNAIEKGKENIYEIAESARAEQERVKKELMAVRQETLQTIQEVDHHERLEKQARLRLMEVSRDFWKHSEEVIKDVYEYADKTRVELYVLREKERNLRLRRDELERSLHRLAGTVEKAEALITQIGVVLQFLQGTLVEINLKLDNLQRMQQFGLQVIQALEEERRRLAREIHDGPAQSLANLVLRAEFCEQLIHRDRAKVVEELQRLKEQVRNSLKDIRKIIFDLRPMVLDDLGLAEGLRRYFTDFKERYAFRGEFFFFGKERRFNSNFEVGFFRVVQESLNNVQKHAQASRVELKLEFLANKVVAVVKDNGRGFDQNRQEVGRDHFGLLNMQERVRLLGGKLEIKSHLGKGTSVIVTIPVEEGEEEIGYD